MAKMILGERFVNGLSTSADWVARAAATGMMALVCGNILLRLFGFPILGTFEIVSFLVAITVAFALPYCSLQKGHIAIELIVRKLPQRIQVVIGLIIEILSLGLFALFAWQVGALATKMYQAGEITDTLKLPIFPFIFGVSVGCLLVCPVLVINIVKSAKKLRQI
jgi:TRAP-type C4-dicarboxylate transport system permease small subunit